MEKDRHYVMKIESEVSLVTLYYIEDNFLYKLLKQKTLHSDYLYALYRYKNDYHGNTKLLSTDNNFCGLIYDEVSQYEYLYNYTSYSLSPIDVYDYYLQYIREQNLDLIINGK